MHLHHVTVAVPDLAISTGPRATRLATAAAAAGQARAAIATDRGEVVVPPDAGW